MKIGIFDSGIGGNHVAKEISRLVPDAEIISISDPENVPYGDKQNSEIIDLTLTATKPLFDADCDAVVIACNTATTVAIGSLRKKYPSTNIIGLEPMIKPAASLTKTKSIIVLATPATLKSNRYKDLVDEWAKGIKIYEPDCSKWANLIETGRLDEVDFVPAIGQTKSGDVDVIVLACTHFHWLKDRIKEELSNNEVIILEPSDAIASRIKQLVV